MATTTETGIEVFVGSDPYALTEDTLKLAKSIKEVIPVLTKAARDALTKKDGRTVCRLDLPGAPLQTWTGSKWGGPPRGQLTATKNTFVTLFGTTKNYLAEAILDVEPDRLLEITIQAEAQANTAGIHAAYTINLGGTSGTVSGSTIKVTNKRYNAANLGEGLNGFSVRQASGAGGSLRFSLQGQVVVGSGTVTSALGAIDITVDDVGPA